MLFALVLQSFGVLPLQCQLLASVIKAALQMRLIIFLHAFLQVGYLIQKLFMLLLELAILLFKRFNSFPQLVVYLFGGVCLVR